MRRTMKWAWFLGLIAAAPLRAAFEDPLWSARSAALGGAFTTIDDDPTGAFYNPAALASARPRGVNFGYAKLFAGVDNVDLSLNQLAYVQPLPEGTTLSLGWGSVVAGGLMREDTVALGAAQRFEHVPLIEVISAGVSLRYLSQKYTLDAARSAGDPVFRDGAQRGVMALDVHAHVPEVDARLPGLSAGVSLRALNKPDVGVGNKVRLPTEAAFGLRYRWGRWSLPLDIVARDGELTPHVGIEGRLAQDRVALRAGTDTHQAGAGLGYTHALRKSLQLQVDYTFLWPLELENSSGSHRATIGVKF
jgi:hypothetical protein